MGPVIDSLLAGLPVFILHVAVALAMLTAAATFYAWATPYEELALIRSGNVAAAVSLGGAIVGLALPLALCLAASVSALDILIWGLVTLGLQLAAYKAVDLMLRDLPRRIEAGEIGAATLLVAVKLAVATILAAAVSG